MTEGLSERTDQFNDDGASAASLGYRLAVEVASTEESALAIQLSAVAVLVAPTDRDHAQSDILLATIFEVLQGGPLSADSIERMIRSTWPHINLAPRVLAQALRSAVDISHVALTDGTYELLEPGSLLLQQTSKSAEQTVVDFVRQVVDELAARRESIVPAEAAALASTVISGVREVVAATFRESAGSTEIDSSGTFRVVDAEVESIDDWLGARLRNPQRIKLTRELIVMCLDPSVAIGKDIVHDLVVGHILYSFMGRPDLVAATNAAGLLTGERIILDTPALIRLVAPAPFAHSMRALLAQATQLGVEVVLYEHTAREFRMLLERLGKTNAIQELEEALQKGGDPLVLATLQREREITWAWLQWTAKQPIGRRTWAAWRASSSGDKSVFTTLKALGANPSAGLIIEENTAASDHFNEFSKELVFQLAPRASARGDST